MEIKVQIVEIYNGIRDNYSQELVFTKGDNVYIGEKFIKHIPTDGIRFDNIFSEKVFSADTPMIDVICAAYDMKYAANDSLNKVALKEMLIHQNASGFSSTIFKEHCNFKTDKELFFWMDENVSKVMNNEITINDIPSDFVTSKLKDAVCEEMFNLKQKNHTR
jgi:hypothetical protein